MATATGGIPIIAFLNEEYNLSEIFDGRLKFEFVDIPVPTFDVTHIYWDHLTANIVEDVLIAVCDGLKGLPEAINTTWEQTVVQQCIVHLIRNSFRYAGRQHRDAIVRSLKPVYTAPSEQAAKDRFEEFAAEWGGRYPAIVQLWKNSWAEFVPFLEYDVEIRRVICTTNAIESINARYRRAVRARGHFPNEAAALKCLYLVTRSLDPTGGGRARWVMRWKPALNAFAITFAGRFEKTTHE